MTIKNVFISENVTKILSSASEPVGYIAGWDASDEKYCVAVSGCPDFFLTGLKVNGFYCILNDLLTSEDEYLRLCELHHVKFNIDFQDVVVLFVDKSKNEDGIANIIGKSYSPYYNTLINLDFKIINSIPAVLLRAKGSLSCFFELSSDKDILKENITQAVDRLKSVFQKGAAAFLLQNTIIQSKSSNQETETTQTVKQLLKSVAGDDSAGSARGKKNIKKKIPTDFRILIQTSGEVAIESSFNHSVVIHCQTRDFQCASFKIPLDVLVFCQDSTPSSCIYKLFVNAIEQQLTQINDCLINYTTCNEADTPVPYHFYPDMWDFPITLVYPLSKTDNDLENYRKELHKRLLLPMDRPFLKKLNVHEFSFKSTSGHLYNPHEGLLSSGVAGGKCALVQGRYTYHHYMQDYMNDDGWGCAYRSLQTIISWFGHQGYTDKTVPTHEEIQKALVAVGDKPESFVKSKKWIGSQEVSFCLDHLINVESKIMFVSSGAEMGSKGRELYNHFKDQGTPVMIGGGVLAHTILGVDFNQDNGELKFLILDPHYTGKEDLSTILSKGWCGWKDVKFWDQIAFYNLCLPQRPNQI